MPHPLVIQLRFARSEFRRGLEGVTEEEGSRRFLPINSISWMVAHLASQEQRYWLAEPLIPAVNELAAYGRPATTPSLKEMLEAWQAITQKTDPALDTLTTELLTTHFVVNGKPVPESIGSMLRRVTYHYWYHTGESQAVRQLLGHTNLPEYVGDIHDEAPYMPEGNS